MKRILVVDDDAEIYELLKAILSPEGFDVLWAENTLRFETMAFGEKPNLMILDIMLGRDNGPSFYNHLLSKGLDRTIPVIFLSGLAGNADAIHAHTGRNYALHAKPFQQKDLLEDIRTLTAAA